MQTHAESENSLRISVSPTKSQETCVHSVKVMNQGRKREYTIQKFTVDSQFKTLTNMKQFLSGMLKFPVDNLNPDMGSKGSNSGLSRMKIYRKCTNPITNGERSCSGVFSHL